MTTFTFTCEGILVLHADGTAECEHGHHCGSDELVHQWWVPCDELGCGCIGEDVAPPLAFAA